MRSWSVPLARISSSTSRCDHHASTYFHAHRHVIRLSFSHAWGAQVTNLFILGATLVIGAIFLYGAQSETPAELCACSVQRDAESDEYVPHHWRPHLRFCHACFIGAHVESDDFAPRGRARRSLVHPPESPRANAAMTSQPDSPTDGSDFSLAPKSVQKC